MFLYEKLKHKRFFNRIQLYVENNAITLTCNKKLHKIKFDIYFLCNITHELCLIFFVKFLFLCLIFMFSFMWKLNYFLITFN